MGKECSLDLCATCRLSEWCDRRMDLNLKSLLERVGSYQNPNFKIV